MHVLAYECMYLKILNACFFLVLLHVDCRLSFFCINVLFFVSFWDHVQYCITWAGSWTSCYIDIIYEYKNMFSLWRKF